MNAPTMTDAEHLAETIARARLDAVKHRTDIVIVNAPIERREDIDNGRGPYGYAPREGFRILFRWGVPVCVVTPGTRTRPGVIKYESTTQAGLFFWAEKETEIEGGLLCWIVTSQMTGYPATEAFDDWLAHFADADDIAQKLAKGEL